MPDNLPAPLTPADCDLQDFKFMPVDVQRVLKSDTWLLATDGERAAAVTLWFESWHQVPAASLPESDRIRAHLSQSKTWTKVREQAMRGWVLCNDGRYYHPVVAEKALEAWIEKLLAAVAGASGNAKRWKMAIDIAAPMAQLQIAIGMLRTLAPQSKALKKKAVISAAAGIPPGSPPDQQAASGGESGGDKGPDRNRQGQRQGQGSSSAPNGAGGEPPKSAAEQEKSRLWATLKASLVEQGTSPDLKGAGELLGKAAKQYGETVFLEAARATVAAKPAPGNTHTYFIGLCEMAAGKRQKLNRPTSHNGLADKDYSEGVKPDGTLI